MSMLNWIDRRGPRTPQSWPKSQPEVGSFVASSLSPKLSSEDVVALHRSDRSEPAEGLLFFERPHWRPRPETRLKPKLARLAGVHDARTIARSIADAVKTYQQHRLQPVSASAEALEAEARMMVLILGIQTAQAAGHKSGSSKHGNA